MNPPGPTPSEHVQHIVKEIRAHLQPVINQGGELGTYLQAHGELLGASLKLRGFAYYWRNGIELEVVWSKNRQELGLETSPEQSDAFRRAAQQCAAAQAPTRLEPNTLPSEDLHGLRVEDSPVPEDLPIFNRTGFEHLFVPIVVSKATVGVFHAWTNPKEEGARDLRVAVIERVCQEIESFLKNQRLADISQQITQLNTYTQMLEELCGDMSSEDVALNLVNYTRETIGCDRVSIFARRQTGGSPHRTRGRGGLNNSPYVLRACSGIRKVNARSEQAEALRTLAERLVLVPTAKSSPSRAPAPGADARAALPPSSQDQNGADTAPVPAPAATAQAGAAATPADAPPAPAAPSPLPPPTVSATAEAERNQTIVIMTQREPVRPDRPPEVSRYFEVIPMNWAIAVALRDRSGDFCGLLLCEGRILPTSVPAVLDRLRSLSVAAGRSLGTAEFWRQRPSFRWAQKWENGRQTLTRTPRRQIFLKYVAPVMALAVLSILPIPFSINGSGLVRPATFNTLPAFFDGKLTEVLVREGDRVTRGQELARFDTYDLNLRLEEAQKDFERATADADLALSSGDEARMQSSRLTAAKADATSRRLLRELQNAVLRAPCDGFVVGPPDLSQKKGAYIAAGQAVVQVARRDVWEMKVQLREQDIVHLQREIERTHQPILGHVKLTANPTQSYDLAITSPGQFSYSPEVDANNKYVFTVTVPFNLPETDKQSMMADFRGRCSFRSGSRPAIYVLLRDFINFLQVRFS